MNCLRRLESPIGVPGFRILHGQEAQPGNQYTAWRVDNGDRGGLNARRGWPCPDEEALWYVGEPWYSRDRTHSCSGYRAGPSYSRAKATFPQSGCASSLSRQITSAGR